MRSIIEPSIGHNLLTECPDTWIKAFQGAITEVGYYLTHAATAGLLVIAMLRTAWTLP